MRNSVLSVLRWGERGTLFLCSPPAFSWCFCNWCSFPSFSSLDGHTHTHSSHLWFSHSMSTTARARPCPLQEPETESLSPTWSQELNYLSHHQLPPKTAIARSWNQELESRYSSMGCNHPTWWFNWCAKYFPRKCSCSYLSWCSGSQVYITFFTSWSVSPF